MIIITFPGVESKRRALGYLSGRFPFKSWANGEMMVSEEALSNLHREGVDYAKAGKKSKSAPKRALKGFASGKNSGKQWDDKRVAR